MSTTSDIFGGIGKAISAKLIFDNITYAGIIDVAFYATISAIMGYGIKKIIDMAVFYLNRQKWTNCLELGLSGTWCLA